MVLINPKRDFGPKTRAFVRAFWKQADVRVNVVETHSLPHFNYNYQTYNPHNYSVAMERDIYAAHKSYQARQFREARREGERVVAVSGRYHEDSAPMLTAFRAEGGIAPKVACFDAHIDWSGSLKRPSDLSAGSFWRWMIDKNMLNGEDLHAIGALRPKKNSAEVNALIKAAVVVLQAKNKDQFVLLASGLAERGFSLDEINSLCHWEADLEFKEENGIRMGEELALHPSGEVVSISFDADVGFEGGAFPKVAFLVPHFRRLRENILAFIHISELDSPLCHFNVSELAGLFARQIALSQDIYA